MEDDVTFPNIFFPHFHVSWRGGICFCAFLSFSIHGSPTLAPKNDVVFLPPPSAFLPGSPSRLTRKGLCVVAFQTFAKSISSVTDVWLTFITTWVRVTVKTSQGVKRIYQGCDPRHAFSCGDKCLWHHVALEPFHPRPTIMSQCIEAFLMLRPFQSISFRLVYL